MSDSSASLKCIEENPFYILACRPDVARAVLEREGQKLLGMLELGLTAARSYQTPVGERTRTPELVRWALAEVRDPERRLMHELWAALPAAPLAEAVEPPATSPDGWADAARVFGWRAR